MIGAPLIDEKLNMRFNLSTLAAREVAPKNPGKFTL
jgi:hypothetical protein